MDLRPEHFKQKLTPMEADNESCCGDATFSVSKFIQFILLFAGSWYCSTKLRYFNNPEFNPLYKAAKPVNQN